MISSIIFPKLLPKDIDNIIKEYYLGLIFNENPLNNWQFVFENLNLKSFQDIVGEIPYINNYYGFFYHEKVIVYYKDEFINMFCEQIFQYLLKFLKCKNNKDWIYVFEHIFCGELFLSNLYRQFTKEKNKRTVTEIFHILNYIGVEIGGSMICKDTIFANDSDLYLYYLKQKRKDIRNRKFSKHMFHSISTTIKEEQVLESIFEDYRQVLKLKKIPNEVMIELSGMICDFHKYVK